MNREDTAKILQLPIRDKGHPPTGHASRYDVLIGRFKECFYRLLDYLHFPAVVRNWNFEDELTGQTVELRIGLFFTRLRINGRDYYFRRLSGKFDGTGYGCS